MPSALTVSSAPEGKVVAVPNVTEVPFEASTWDIDRVAPGFVSVSLVNRLPVVKGV